MKTRVFLDANVLIAAADSRSGASHAVLVLAEIGLLTPVVSRQVLDEAERPIRTKLPRALANFAEQMAHLPLEIIPNAPQQEFEKWTSVIEAKFARSIDAKFGMTDAMDLGNRVL